jgi:hypothetical protein
MRLKIRCDGESWKILGTKQAHILAPIVDHPARLHHMINNVIAVVAYYTPPLSPFLLSLPPTPKPKASNP